VAVVMENSAQTTTTGNVSITNPLWQLFLESSCSSATVFFKLQVNQYFHSPTPWISPSSNIPIKVAKLMDSFRPGSSSYCPFPNEDEIINNSDIEGGVNEPTNDDLQTNNVSFVNLHSVTNDASSTSDNDDTDNENSETTEDVSNDESRESSEEENRRRLYLNTGRPRPFYRVHSSSPPQSLLETAPVTSTRTSNQCKQKKRTARSLQEIVRNYFVSKYGLEYLSRIVKRRQLCPQLPASIKYYLLTFPCMDFEEIGNCRPATAASYHVKCKLDGRKYTAIFATSEMDKATYNVWKDKEDWLDNIEGVQEILATCIDAVTENIFYIIRDGYTALAEVRDLSDITGNGAQDGSAICEKVKEGLQTIEKLGLSYKLTSENQILLHEKNIYLQNPLLLKRTQTQESEKVSLAENYLQLSVILTRILNSDGSGSQEVEENSDMTRTSI